MPLPRKPKEEAYQCHVGDTIQLGNIKVILDQSLGKGSFGEVFKGRDSEGKIVAVKQLSIEGDDAQGKIAKKELDNFQKLQDHPNLVKLLDHHFARSSIWLVMEFCDLGNLDEFVLLSQKPDLKTKVGLMRQIAQGLAHMHTQAIPVIHRDIKPANILMASAQGEPIAKIADFSLSKFKDPATALESCLMTTPGGTQTFMAPEGKGYEPEIPIGSAMCTMIRIRGTVDPVCMITANVSSPTETGVRELIIKMTCVKRDERLTACQVRDDLEELYASSISNTTQQARRHLQQHLQQQLLQQQLEPTQPKTIITNPTQVTQIAATSNQNSTAPAKKKGLFLTREQMLEAQEMFRTSNKVTRPEKALILGFMAGERKNPSSEQGDLVKIKLSENRDSILQPDGTFRSMIVESYFQMDYSTGKWEKIKEFRETDKD